MNWSDFAIIGAGAAGLFGARLAAKADVKFNLNFPAFR